MKRKGIALILCVFMLLTLFPTATIAKDNTSNQQKSNGDIIVSVLQGDKWQEAGRLSFDRFYSEKKLDIGKFMPTTGPVKLSLVQNGGGAAQLDSVILGGNVPNAINIDEDLALKKISAKDFDVINIGTRGIEVSIAADGQNTILQLTARIETEIISQTPFQFPEKNNSQAVDENAAFYTYEFNSNKATPEQSSILTEFQDQKPFLKEFCLPGSGHPAGYLYGWVANDDENLYVALDVTSDNTMDGDKDYARVNIKTAAGVKTFKVSVPETDWGKASFVYTDKVGYQHKAYEFVIPLHEIDIENQKQVKDIPLAFTVYGTMSYPVYFSTEARNTDENIGSATITIYRSIYNDIAYPGDITIKYWTQEGTAKAGEDYQSVSDTFTFTEGITETRFQIPILNDIYYEGFENIILKLSIVNSDNTETDVYPSYLNIYDEWGEFKFSSPTYSVNEGDGTAAITVDYTGDYLRQEPVPTITQEEIAYIDYRTSDGSATEPDDYTKVNDRIRIYMGSNQASFTVEIKEDLDVEEPETVKLYLYQKESFASVQSSSDDPHYAELTILDNDGETPENSTFQFEDKYYSVDEAGVTANLVVKRTESTGVAAVRYRTSCVNAFPGTDYGTIGNEGIELIRTLNFERGQEKATIAIPIINDDIIEGSESLDVVLEAINEGDRIVEGYNKACLEIHDEEGYFAFSSPTYRVAENAGAAEIQVNYTGDYMLPEPRPTLQSEEIPQVFRFINYETSDGTAVDTADYAYTQGTLALLYGENTKTFKVPINDDTIDENDETVNLKLYSVAYLAKSRLEASVDPSKAVLTIVDNENPPVYQDDEDDYTPVVTQTPPPPPAPQPPDGGVIIRLSEYIPVSAPVNIKDAKGELTLDYGSANMSNNAKYFMRACYWNDNAKKWVAMTTKIDETGKIKAINDGGYSGWFRVFGSVQPIFIDVSGNKTEDIINRLNGLGIIEGYIEDSDFSHRTAKLNQDITREEFATFVYRMLNLNPDKRILPALTKEESKMILTKKFSDEDKIIWWSKAIIAAVADANLIEGRNGKFDADEPITTVEAAKMFNKALNMLPGFKGTDFSKFKAAADVPLWAKAAVSDESLAAYTQENLTKNENIKRADAIEALYKLFIITMGW